MSLPTSRAILAVAALLLASATPVVAHGAEFVSGGYGAALTGGSALDAEAAATDGQDPVVAGDSAVLFDFTPRGAGMPAMGSGEDAPRLRFEFGAGGGEGGLDALGLGGSAGPSWLDEGVAAGPRRLSLGGALVWSGWSIGGGFARSDLAGGAADLLSATVGFGPLSTSLAYGQAGGSGDQPSRGVLMLSTDLSAWSWLTFESDVALGESADGAPAESVAVGRLGVRLNF